MNIDFYNEIRYNLKIFCYLIRKKNIKTKDIERMILLLGDMIHLLEIYLYEYLDD